MARGKYRNKKGNKRNSGNKFKNDKKKGKPKKRSIKEIKHVELFKKYKAQVRAQARNKPQSESEEEVEEEKQIQLDPVDQLLSTFNGNGNDFANNAAVDSEESSEEEEEEMEVEDAPDIESHEADQTDITEENQDNDESEVAAETSQNGVTLDDDSADVDDKFENESTDGKDVEEVSNLNDPFNIHLNYDLDDSLLESVTVSLPKLQTSTLYWPVLHNLKIEIPVSRNKNEDKKADEIYIGDTKEYAKQGKPPTLITDVSWDKLYVKAQIQDNIAKANSKQLGDKYKNELLTPLQKELFAIMNNYQDLFYPERNISNGEEVRFAYCLHAVNHLMKTRTKILHHNEKLSKKIKEQVPDKYRDQGLVRPKVLILAPFRDSCLRIVNMIISIVIANDKGNVLKKTKFLEEFSGSELAMPKKRPKPEDYEQLFKGNIDDTFRIGISITKKSIKLYSEFYSSDIIVASPLGLRIIIGAEGDRVRDFDFLSSIELLILDQSEVFLMQNWDHLLLVFDNLHMQPKQNHNTDISRIRSWAINGWTKYYRQTLIFSSIVVPELNSLFNKRCQNYAGKVRIANPVDNGSIRHIVVPIAQVFQKFKANSPADAIEERFKVLVEKILPQYRDPLMTGVLIYVPSYFDYVRIRNYLKKETFTFVQICEYSKDAKVARARDMFFHNQARFLLYSERFHFFRRVRLKGIRHIIFYQPPTFPHFYSEICNLMHENFQNKFVPNDGNTTVTVMYCKYDIHRISAIVKTSRAAKMITSDKDVHMFTTG